MPLGSLLLILALLLIVALFVARPFLQGERWARGEDEESSHLLAERERILEALLELDFDHELGKVPEDVYVSQREALMGKGAKVLEGLDQHAKETGESRPKQGDDLEAMIAAHKKRRR